jgi:glycosyltransferase involved in cell wall biosynthesis
MRTDKPPRVSIITAVYNAEKFIGHCLSSTIAQSFEDWEQIIVDDGSSDGTEDVVRQFKDSRLHYIRLPHRGLPALAESYNTAFRAARGELVAILEGDDAWSSNKLQRHVPVFDDPAVVLSWSKALIIDDDGVVIRRWPVPREFQRDLSMPELFRVLARWNILGPTMTVMVRRAALDAVGGFQQTGSSLYVDLPTWLTVSATVPGLARYVDEDLGYFRSHSSNTGKVHNSKMRIEHAEVFAQVARHLGPEQLRKLGWTARDERIAQASTNVSHGIAYFQEGDRIRAQAAFRAAMRLTRSPREYAIACVGYLSAVGDVNLIGRAQQLRASAAALSLRIHS